MVWVTVPNQIAHWVLDGLFAFRMDPEKLNPITQ
jgi:hypothetical protein